MQKYALAFLTFLALSLCLQAQAQDLTFEQANIIFGKQRILTFRKFSLELTDESKAELQKIAELCRVSPGMMRRTLLVIQVFTCEQELAVKPYIGVCRGQVVIDYLEEAIGLSRKKCLVRDVGSNPLDTDCLAGSAVTLYLKPDWVEKY